MTTLVSRLGQQMTKLSGFPSGAHFSRTILVARERARQAMATAASAAAGEARTAAAAATRAANDSKDPSAKVDLSPRSAFLQGRPFSEEQLASDKKEEDAIKTPPSSSPLQNKNIIINLVTTALGSIASPFYMGFIFAQYIFDVMGSDTRFIGAGTTLMGIAQMIVTYSVSKAADEGSKQRVVYFGATFSMAVSLACIFVVFLFSIAEPVCYWCYA